MVRAGSLSKPNFFQSRGMKMQNKIAMPRQSSVIGLVVNEKLPNTIGKSLPDFAKRPIRSG